MRKLFVTSLLICSLAIVGPAWAGWIIEQTNEGMASTLYIQDNKLRQDTGQGMYSMLDVDKGLMYFIRPDKKMYAAVRPEEMSKQSDQMMGDMMKKMEEQLKGMPEEQKKQIMKQMKEQMAGQQGKAAAKPEPKIEIIKTSVKEKIAGYSTVKYQIMADGKLVEELWLADAIKIGKEMDLEKMDEMMSKMDMGSEDMSYKTDKAVTALFKKGYPLRESYPDSNMTTETTKATKTKVPGDKFKIPAGYKKGKFSEVMMAQ